MPKYYNVKYFDFDHVTDDVLKNLLREAMMLKAKAAGAEAAYREAAVSHFNRVFRSKYGAYCERLSGWIEYLDGRIEVELLGVKFWYVDEMQVQYRTKTKSGKWAKTTNMENASYVLKHFVVKKPA